MVPNTQYLIECQGVGVSFRQGNANNTVLANLDFAIPNGQIVSLLGPSGCGKSTLLRVVAGLIKPTTGNITVAGSSPADARSQMSFVFQEASLLPWRTVWQNVLLPLELRGTRKDAGSKEWVEYLLALVGFRPQDWNKLPTQLSGGMKMRASIARALVTKPNILLFDEPFAALDDMLRTKLNDLLLTIASDRSKTILFVTHNIAEAIYLSDSIAVMSRGGIGVHLNVPLAFPRDSKIRSSSEFASFYGTVSDALMEHNREENR